MSKDRQHREMRTERDSMGDVDVPHDALFGAQTARAVRNFPVSGRTLPPDLLHALGLIKLAAAEVNRDLNLLNMSIAEVIMTAAREVVEGLLDNQFPVDIYQTGSGTSSNMNVNEVIANRANQLLGSPLGSKDPVHPNDHVNLGQSSNDVFPSAIHVAVVRSVEGDLLPALENLRICLKRKSHEFDHVLKVGRTHLQDASPIRLGQEFSGYEWQIRESIGWIRRSTQDLGSLALGGTAVGTGINTHPEFGARVAATISRLTGLKFRETANHFAAQGSQDSAVRFSGSLRDLAMALMKIANDIRWLGSGPRSGLGELKIPAVQPGSSIMPGKVNPVIAEALIMVCAQVLGLDVAVATAGSWGAFELNTMLPMIGDNLLTSVRMLSGGVRTFAENLVEGLEVNSAGLSEAAEYSLGMAAALTPAIGYDAAARLAHESVQTGKSIRTIAIDRELLDPEELDALLDLRRLTGPGLPTN